MWCRSPTIAELRAPGRAPGAAWALVAVALLSCSRPATCPPEMAIAMTADARPVCVDRWEGLVTDAAGRPLQNLTMPPPADATVRSAAGVLPTVGVTFDEARALCARTPAVYDGVPRGTKHLATPEEWLAAAAGSPLPAAPDHVTPPNGEAVCATMEAGVKGVGLTGSLPRCVSRAGVYDQLGNVFEWVDPGLTVDSARALATFAKRGVPLTVDADGLLVAPAGSDLRHLVTDATAILPGPIRRDEAGHLWMRWQGSLPNPSGYLTVDDWTRAGPDSLLPVRFQTTPGQAEARLAALPEADGAAIPEKIGGAWYQRTAAAVGTRAHLSTFRGTIGLRCAAPPGGE